MQNGTSNGPSPQDERVTPVSDLTPLSGSLIESSSDSAPHEPIPSKPKDVEAAHQPEEPPSKKRRLTDSSSSQRSTPRPPSPPWKKAGFEGPTSFFSEGKRRSSRTNAVPIELQPGSDKRHTRGAQSKNVGKSARDGSKPATSSPLSVTQSRADVNGKLGGKVTANGSPRAPSRASANKPPRISQTSAPKPSYSRTKSRSSATLPRLSSTNVNGTSSRSLRDRPFLSNLSHEVDRASDDTSVDDRELEQRSLKIPKLRIKLNKPVLPIRHPGHIPQRKFTSFREWVYQNDTANILSEDEAAVEARKRLEVVTAAEPGGPLSAQVCSAYITEQQEEPPPQYSHQDHLVSHALYFQKLLDKEHKRHRQTAKLFAQWCADAYRKCHKNPEDILREQQEEMRGKRKQLSKDLQKMFDLTRADIDRVRLARWEEERKMEDQQALDRAIKKSTMLFEKRRSEILGELPSDAPVTSDDEDNASGFSSGLDEEDESNMSESESGTDDETNVDDDATLTAEELRRKYANLPAEDYTDRTSIASGSTAMTNPNESLNPEAVLDGLDSNAILEDTQLDDVDSVLMDDSDASTDMDDDMGDSDEDEEDLSDEESDEDDETRSGLLGFFSKNETPVLEDGEQASAVGHEQDIDSKSASGGEDDVDFEDQDEVSLVPIRPMTSEGTSTEGTPFYIANASETSPATGGETPAIDTPMEEELAKVEAEDAATAAPADDNDHPQPMELDHVHDGRLSGEMSSEPSPGTFATKPSEPESVSSLEPTIEKALQISHSPAPGLQTPIPHILRGTLREYQHYGLDWLAGLYKNHINGILADEMGLGKTIQTIALLAHLAVEHGIWGPHLVVVPTSVMLNWEMEFKKWCPGFKIMTYYGNQEERKQKRRGWTDDNAWNVLITSYQLVLQDQMSLKRKDWHYMILDEAHNIKNFRSQRWQALLTFKSRARLLLTGTPLQNNLTELWSLLFFLMPSDGTNGGVDGFADLKDFSEWFRRPVEQILEHGRETMDEEAKGVVTKLHTVLRPYLLRRLKADVEKQMPGKYEHVVYCRLSKRQRYLYDGFMSMAQTKETLASGNFLSIIHCLMQLRKVCNHPDLFETRQISTSFAMPRSVAMDFNLKESLVRRRLLFEHPLTKIDFDFLNLAPVSREDISRRLADDSIRLMAIGPFKSLRERQYNRTNWEMEFDGSNMQTVLESLENACRKRRMAELERCLYFESKRHGRRPIYGCSLVEFLRAGTKEHALSNAPLRKRSMADWLSSRSSVLASIILTVEERALEMHGYVQRFACVTPAAVAAGMNEAALTPVETRLLTNNRPNPPYDPFHEARMRLSIAFPDKRLLQYDCGKLQRLDKLLRDLKAGGHRALIFTQMTKMLDILEQFLNIHGHRYLRLDGTTKVESRQMLTERFNSDPRILAFILSSRSGGLGINLTGADTVIFYDLDWNPAMDKQCQDRCHRIGQTRDVHIYRFVSEYTIESNILRKANQKRMLDDVIIQEGEFTTDYFTKLNAQEIAEPDERDGQDEASAAMDRVLGNRVGGGTRVFEAAEDKEDLDAAKNAQKEQEHADDGDFEEHSTSHGTPAQVGTPLVEDTEPVPLQVSDPDAELQPGHIDDYLLRFMEWNMRDEPLVLPADKSKKKSKKGKEHHLKRRR
ncbi:Helicase swr1 [Penicillium digitatum]|uniref:DNA helicase n=2 Tax=Penicillium digitatum TaxID=36651 RepID=K9FQG4_PEND1|nr:Helicase swr1 [Penicillium digitatum Pd1]EKV11389.1 Helicase swr1 [Penicillium digitatum Pd1]QQK43824.1 Helicase swr1 [Penicillium digitatum]